MHVCRLDVFQFFFRPVVSAYSLNETRINGPIPWSGSVCAALKAFRAYSCVFIYAYQTNFPCSEHTNTAIVDDGGNIRHKKVPDLRLHVTQIYAGGMCASTVRRVHNSIWIVCVCMSTPERERERTREHGRLYNGRINVHTYPTYRLPNAKA